MRACVSLTAMLLAGLPAAASAANTFSSDASDMWWNPDESGWGLNLVQENNVLFATIYVYAADGSAHWFVAPDMETTQGPEATSYTFSGALYETTGPVFSGAFNPNAVGRRVVGTASFQYSVSNAGIFSYSVDGKAVTERVQRMTWRVPDIGGEYYVWRNIRSRDCTDMGNASYDYIVQQSGNSVSIQAYSGVTLQCTWNGTLAQSGRMGSIAATGTCAGAPASLRIDDLEVGVQGFLGRLTATEHGCTLYGRIAGVNASTPPA